MSVGLKGNRPASAAAAKTKIIQAIAAQNSGPNRRGRGTGLAAISSSMLSSSVAMTDPRIEDGVEHVHNEVHQHVATGNEQYHTLQDNEVAGKDGAQQQPADSGPRQNRSDNNPPPDQTADIEAGYGNKGQRRRLQ